MKKLAYLFAAISAELSALHLVRIRSAADIILVVPKLLVGALSPYLAVFGLLGAVLGLLYRAPLAIGAGLFGFLVSGRFVRRVASTCGDLDAAFGPNTLQRIPESREAEMLAGRWTWRPADHLDFHLQKDVPFWTVSDCDRTLLCDIWLPSNSCPPSGLGIIYLHGSGWTWLDKDMGTRPMFRRLTAQGHVIMDVAYRLCPDTDWRGMLGDVKRAIVWLKTNAARYGTDPEHIVVAGGSAGGQLALLAAYTADRTELRPADVGDADLSVCGVVSWYGPTDMRVYYDYAGQKFDTVFQRSERQPGERFNRWVYSNLGVDLTPMSKWQPGLTVQDNMMLPLFGGTPAECPEEYRLASPVEHVGPHCPPTLLLQGSHDFLVSAVSVRLMADRLRQAGVPVVHVEYPQTDHAFDLILPRLSPAAQAATYETERFLMLLV